MRNLLLILLLAMTLIGCGGGGIGGSNNALRNRYQALMNDINDEDLNDTMSNYSFDFFNDCQDWQDVRDGWEDIFTTPNYHLELDDLQITFSDINGDFGVLEGSFRSTENDNGFITEEIVDFAMDFVREDGTWRLYGNQACDDAAKSQTLTKKEKVKLLLRSIRKK